MVWARTGDRLFFYNDLKTVPKEQKFTIKYSGILPGLWLKINSKNLRHETSQIFDKINFKNPQKTATNSTSNNRPFQFILDYYYIVQIHYIQLDTLVVLINMSTYYSRNCSTTLSGCILHYCDVLTLFLRMRI